MIAIGGKNRKKILAIVAVIIIVVSSFTINSFIFSNHSVKKEVGPGLELSIMPYHGQTNNSSTAQLINASVQIYMNNPPKVTQGIEAFTNTTPLFNAVVDSTGNLSGNLSASFFSLAENWTLYFMETNNTGASTSLTMEVSYLYKNGSYDYVSYNTVIIPIDPAFFVSPVGVFNKITSIEGYHNLYHLNIASHPSLSSLKEYRVQDVSPMGIAGGSGHYMWALIKQHTLSNYPIPLAWANNSIVKNNNEVMDLQVYLGFFSQESLFHPGQATYQNGTYSWSILNGSSYESPEVNGIGTSGGIAFNAIPVKEGAPNAIMLYVNGTITIDVYKLYVNTAEGWQPTDNIQSVTEFASLNIVNTNLFQMGFMGLSWGSSWSLMEPENLVKYLLTSSPSGYIKTAYYNISNEGTAQWGALEDNISSSSINIWPFISSVLGVGFSVIGVIAAADGWVPGSGWANMAADVLAFTGLASSIYGYVEGMVTGVSNNVFLFGGSITLQNLPSLGSPNSLELKVITNNAPLGIITSNNGAITTDQYNIPVFDLSAISQ